MRRPARRGRAAGAAIAVALLLAGCGAGATPDAAEDAAEDGVAVDHEVVLSEMAVGVTSSWQPGEQTLRVRNAGGAHHNLIVCPGDETGCDDGGGVPMDVVVKPDVRDPDVIPDRTSSLVLGAGAEAVVRTDPLEAGRYLLWCAIPNHAARGMQQVIEVG